MSARPDPAQIAVYAVRWIVKHLHPSAEAPLAEAPGSKAAPSTEVFVTYSAEHPDALSFAISTASRYEGVIYAEDDLGEYAFYRSYRARRGAPVRPLAA